MSDGFVLFRDDEGILRLIQIVSGKVFSLVPLKEDARKPLGFYAADKVGLLADAIDNAKSTPIVRDGKSIVRATPALDTQIADTHRKATPEHVKAIASTVYRIADKLKFPRNKVRVVNKYVQHDIKGIDPKGVKAQYDFKTGNIIFYPIGLESAKPSYIAPIFIHELTHGKFERFIKEHKDDKEFEILIADPNALKKGAADVSEYAVKAFKQYSLLNALHETIADMAKLNKTNTRSPQLNKLYRMVVEGKDADEIDSEDEQEELKMKAAKDAGSFVEGDHPRNQGGEFTSGGSGTSSHVSALKAAEQEQSFEKLNAALENAKKLSFADLHKVAEEYGLAPPGRYKTKGAALEGIKQAFIRNARFANKIKKDETPKDKWKPDTEAGLNSNKFGNNFRKSYQENAKERKAKKYDTLKKWNAEGMEHIKSGFKNAQDAGEELIGKFVVFQQPTIYYEKGQPKKGTKKLRGKVTRMKNGKMEVRVTDGGYYELTPNEIMSHDSRGNPYKEVQHNGRLPESEARQFGAFIGSPERREPMRKSFVGDASPSLTEWLERKLGTRKWVVARRSSKLVEKGYEVFLSPEKYRQLENEFHSLYPEKNWRKSFAGDISLYCHNRVHERMIAMDKRNAVIIRARSNSNFDRIALDKSSTRDYDIDGRLHVEMANISKAVVNPYVGNEIPDYQKLGLDPKKIYYLYRDPDELEKAAATFNGLPLLSEHQPVTADSHDHKLVVGSMGTSAHFRFPYLRNSLVVWPEADIRQIEKNKKRQLSAGYRYTADMTPGVSPSGERYDGVMRDIVGNHVALVTEGRAGSDVVVGDAKLKTAETWTVRNKKGQLIGRYRATSAEAAIRKCLDEDAVQGSQFKSYTRLRSDDLVAKVE